MRSGVIYVKQYPRIKPDPQNGVLWYIPHVQSGDLETIQPDHLGLNVLKDMSRFIILFYGYLSSYNIQGDCTW